MKNNQFSKDQGLPEITQAIKNNKYIYIGMLFFILIGCMSMYFVSKGHLKETTVISEPDIFKPKGQLEAPKMIAIPQKEKQSKPVTEEHGHKDIELTREQLAFIQAKQNELQQRLAAPLMLVNNTQSVTKLDAAAKENQAASNDRNIQFLNQVSEHGADTAIAKPLGSLKYIIAQGKLIHAVMESATNSDLPGFIRATVSQPSYSEDGSQILIPRNSRLIGQYKSGMLQGQSRIFIVWTRLITPKGISIQLGSPGVDSLGMAGIGADEIDRHFWQRFGTASLLSVLGAGTANLGVNGSDQDNSVSTYRSAIANSFMQSADQSLQQNNKIPPTLVTYQGKPVVVFVAKDLDFQSSMKLIKPSLNIL